MARELEGYAVPKSVLALDADEVNLHMMKNTFHELGVSEISLTSDPKAAWQQITVKHYDFLVIDWELPEIPGVMLFNRIRSLPQFATIPVMLLSNISYPKEFKLFQEYPLSMLVEKPMTQKKFERMVGALLKEQSFFTAHEGAIDQILAQAGEASARALKNVLELMDKSPNPGPIACLAGRKFLEHTKYQEAERVFRALLKSDHQSILAMSGLAKSLVRLEKFDEAAETLKYAHKYSPKGLERLHLLGETELKRGAMSDAKHWFEDALAIDPEDQTAKAGLMVADNIELYRKRNPEDDATKNFAGLLNVIGISMVRKGSFQEGIAQYEAALKFVSEGVDQAKLAFNAGLGCLRAKDKQAAYEWFKRSAEAGGQAFDKSQAYVAQLEQDAEVSASDIPEPEKF